MGDDQFIPGDPSRLRADKREESPDSLGVFGGTGSVTPSNDPGALSIPGVFNIADSPKAKAELKAQNSAVPKKKLTKEQLAKVRRENLRKGREAKAARAAAQMATGEALYDEGASFQASVQRSSSVSSPTVVKPSPPELSSRPTDCLYVELPEITMDNMAEVEAAIINGRRQIDAYAKEAQKLAQSSRDRRCEWCRRPIQDGRWYSRDCPIDPNGNLKWDKVWCSQPCDIQSKLQAQGADSDPSRQFFNLAQR
ncbi:MAG TPA: hypothetical protein VFL79_19625 [Terriglobia bacterium]|nr:hypothetical protein [Terriglobia bacterium]